MNNKKAKEIRQGIRLNIRKAPKIEKPKNLYSRQQNKKEVRQCQEQQK